MARKVNLTVPDDLHEKMQKWKGKLNFSGIFQRALVEAIEGKEQFYERLEEDQTMAQIIERLREEKIEVEGDPYGEGRKEGLSFAKAAHYSELKTLSEWNVLARSLPQELSDYFDNVMTEDENLSWEDWQHERHNSYTYKFWQAWRKAVEDFWNEVKDKL